MASMGSIYPYGHLIRTARAGVTFVPRRTLTYSVSRRAQEDNGNSANELPPPPPPQQQQQQQQQEQQQPKKTSAFSSFKNFFFGRKKSDPEAEKPKITRRPQAPIKREGSLSADSIFAEDEPSPKLTATGRTPQLQQPVEREDGAEGNRVPTLEERTWSHMQPALDPRPEARRKWERKMVIREIRRRGRLSKAEIIMRTERESLSKSHWFKTSLKKLGPLARQIAGKNIDDAILQMRFSKKKVAKDVLEHLEHAKNQAIVRHGMGLGAAQGTASPAQKPVKITLKTGERMKITDPTSIYIAQAWVNRGPYEKRFEHRARGAVNTLRPPYTSLSVLLKEEKTRVREWQDREAEALRKRKAQLWTQLPDRKITAQNPYYSW